MKKFLTIFILGTLISGCATYIAKMQAPPLPNRLELLKKLVGTPETEAEDWAKQYFEATKAQATGNLKLACKIFTGLSKKNNFPIMETALLHSMETCDLSTGDLEDIWKNKTVPNYLKERYFELSRNLAIKKNRPFYEAQFSYEIIPFKKIQSEKVILIKRAIAIATELAEKDKISLYQNKLIEISPLYNTDINDTNIYSIAKDFEINRNFDSARELYKKIVVGSFPLAEKVKAFNAYRTTYKVERNLKVFLEKTFEMQSFLKAESTKNPTSETNEAWVESTINLARAVWTEHRNSDAKRILDELFHSNLGTLNQIANAHWLYGSLHMENKSPLEALAEYEIASKIKVTDINLQENIQWALVWNNYVLKINENVVLYADKFNSRSKNINFINKLNYWKAKALLRLHNDEEAQAIFEKIISNDPFSYYGIIATIDLNSPLKPLQKTKINTDPTGNHVLDWLIAVDEKNLAQKYLKEIDSQFKTPIERERAMSLYAQTEWYQGGMRQIYNFSTSTKNAMTEKYINIIFPTPYLDLVSKHGHTYNVPSELVYGIIRQESAFVATERSWADAFGLMQMIPEKATELSKKYAIPYRDYNDLYRPDTNIEMGTALLKDLREKFESKFIQSVAAYNASEEVIKIWERDRFNGNYFEFIEMIPYEETRNYIKLVFRNYIIYKRITNTEEFHIDKDFFSKPF